MSKAAGWGEKAVEVFMTIPVDGDVATYDALKNDGVGGQRATLYYRTTS